MPTPICSEVGLTIKLMKADYQAMLSNVAAQEAQVQLDQVTFDRNARFGRRR